MARCEFSITIMNQSNQPHYLLLVTPTNSSLSDTLQVKSPCSCNIQEIMIISDPAKPTNSEICEKYSINLYIPNIEFTSISLVQRKWNFALI